MHDFEYDSGKGLKRENGLHVDKLSFTSHRMMIHFRVSIIREPIRGFRNKFIVNGRFKSFHNWRLLLTIK